MEAHLPRRQGCNADDERRRKESGQPCGNAHNRAWWVGDGFAPVKGFQRLFYDGQGTVEVRRRQIGRSPIKEACCSRAWTGGHDVNASFGEFVLDGLAKMKHKAFGRCITRHIREGLKARVGRQVDDAAATSS